LRAKAADANRSDASIDPSNGDAKAALARVSAK
jgi:hypothetical protein